MLLPMSSGLVSSMWLRKKWSGMMVVQGQGTRGHRESIRTPCLGVPGGVPERETASGCAAGFCDGAW